MKITCEKDFFNSFGYCHLFDIRHKHIYHYFPGNMTMIIRIHSICNRQIDIYKNPKPK